MKNARLEKAGDQSPVLSMPMLLFELLCLVAGSAASPSLRGGSSPGVEESSAVGSAPYGLVVFTAAIGRKYENLAVDWCLSLRDHVTSKLAFNTATVVLVDKPKNLEGCETLAVSLPEYASDLGQRALRIKTLKMMHLPEQFESQVYMWLDVDVRPVPTLAPWLQKLLSRIVRSQTSEKPMLPEKSIALTRTRRNIRYNGGLFLYADRACVNMWKQEIHQGDATDRDQPALLKVTSHDCNVVDLPARTQGYFTTLQKVNALLGRRDRAYNHALMHFTGNAHKSNYWFQFVRS